MNLLQKICDKLGISLDFLNRDNSPSSKISQKTKLKNASGNTVNQAGGNIYVSPPPITVQKPRIDLGGKFVPTGSAEGYVIYFNVKNDGDAPAVDIRYYFTADDLQSETMAPQTIIHTLSPGETSKPLTMFKCSGTEFYTRQLTNPRVVFVYKDRSGNDFQSGRHIQQTSRADGNFNTATDPGAYFEDQ